MSDTINYLSFSLSLSLALSPLLAHSPYLHSLFISLPFISQSLAPYILSLPFSPLLDLPSLTLHVFYLPLSLSDSRYLLSLSTPLSLSISSLSPISLTISSLCISSYSLSLSISSLSPSRSLHPPVTHPLALPLSLFISLTLHIFSLPISLTLSLYIVYTPHTFHLMTITIT